MDINLRFSPNSMVTHTHTRTHTHKHTQTHTNTHTHTISQSQTHIHKHIQEVYPLSFFFLTVCLLLPVTDASVHCQLIFSVTQNSLLFLVVYRLNFSHLLIFVNPCKYIRREATYSYFFLNYVNSHYLKGFKLRFMFPDMRLTL